jgi:hypothetical protein
MHGGELTNAYTIFVRKTEEEDTWETLAYMRRQYYRNRMRQHGLDLSVVLNSGRLVNMSMNLKFHKS